MLSLFILFSLPPTASRLQTPSTIAAWLSLWIWPVAYRFSYKRLWISWFTRLRFCGHCRNLKFTKTRERKIAIIRLWILDVIELKCWTESCQSETLRSILHAGGYSIRTLSKSFTQNLLGNTNVMSNVKFRSLRSMSMQVYCIET